MLPKYVEDILEEEGKNESFISYWMWKSPKLISKICQDSETFTEIMIASRTKSKCDDLEG